MSVDWESLPSTLRSALRPVPPLASEDSLRRFLYISRQYALATLPIMQNGSLCGTLTTQTLWPLLATEDAEAREQALDQPISNFMSPPGILARPDMSLQEVGQLCGRHALDTVPVVDAEGFCLGMVSAFDLLLTDSPPPRPPMMGGMATPFGVYLTDGSHQAGAGNWALVSAGVALGLLHFIAYLIIGSGVRLVQSLAHLPGTPIYRLDYEAPVHQPTLGLISVGIHLLQTLVFLALIRVSIIAGYHAAEHQSVHALEHGERLLPDIVRRMPRPHPRCGTNFLAAGLIFINISLLLTYIPNFDASSAALLAALTVMFTWRQFGTFLQEKFTTRPASPKQIESGIAAANSLLEQYWNSPPVRTTLARRIWCMGIFQVFIGLAPTILLTLYLADRLKI